jgi:hypothetical protein
MRCALYCFLILSFCATVADAHEMRPAYLQLRQTNTDTYDAFWKVPAAGDNMRLSLYVQLPENCSDVADHRGSFAAGAFTETWSFKCQRGLAGNTIRFTGLTATLTDVLVRVERLDGSKQVTRVTSAATSFVVEAAPRRFEVARTYLVLGVEHILTGVDHLLFVSGLLLLVGGFTRLIKTVSAFTLSHSVTLTLATLGFVHIPPAPVEAVIALSIVFVAYEALRSHAHSQGIAQRKPWLVAFTFGLLHGLGFAGGLSAAGLPSGHIPLALAFFSVGVEVGHFSFVGTAVLLMIAIRQWKFRQPVWAWRLPLYAIGATACYWLIARLAAV